MAAAPPQVQYVTHRLRRESVRYSLDKRDRSEDIRRDSAQYQPENEPERPSRPDRLQGQRSCRTRHLLTCHGHYFRKVRVDGQKLKAHHVFRGQIFEDN